MNLFTDPVFLVELVMLSAVLTVGLYTSYTDLKLRRVPNRYTFALLAIGLAGQLTMILLDVTSLSRVVALLLTALAIAFGLTLLGFWSPGDAKLYWAAALALPPTLCPSTDPFSLQAAPVALVVNALLGYLLVLLLVPVWQRAWQQAPEQDRPEGRPWLLAAWGLAGLLGWALSLAWLVLERPLSYLEMLGALVIGYRLLERGLEVRYWPVVLVPGLVALLYLGQATGGWQAYVLMWGAVWLLELAYGQVRHRYSRAFVQSFPVGLLQAGAIPRQALFAAGAEAEEAPVCEAGRPLTEQQVRRVQKLAREGRLSGGGVVEVEQSMPFVPFITGGVVVTAFFAGNLVPPLIEWVGWLRG